MPMPIHSNVEKLWFTDEEKHTLGNSMLEQILIKKLGKNLKKQLQSRISQMAKLWFSHQT